MPDTPEQLAAQNAALTRQLLEWIASEPRDYSAALEVWRSTCPRHSIWEDAFIDGLLDRAGGRVTLTAAGRARLAEPR
jgi:hypothetical protein